MTDTVYYELYNDYYSILCMQTSTTATVYTVLQ